MVRSRDVQLVKQRCAVTEGVGGGNCVTELLNDVMVRRAAATHLP